MIVSWVIFVAEKQDDLHGKGTAGRSLWAFTLQGRVLDESDWSSLFMLYQMKGNKRSIFLKRFILPKLKFKLYPQEQLLDFNYY